MATETEMEMDLSLMYGDVEDFGQDSEFNDNDLFDDMIASRSNDASGDAKHSLHTVRSGSYSGSYSGKRIALYVANLTWWTTDQDLADAMNGIGVADVLEIKFNENRANGQSKGFATVVVGSDNSCRLMLEKLSRREIHGQALVVTHATRQALKQFDTQPRKDSQPNGPHTSIPPRGPPGMPPQQGRPPPQFAAPGGFHGVGPRLGPPPTAGAHSGPPPSGVPMSGITILQAPRPYPSQPLPPPPVGHFALVQTQPGQPPIAMAMAPPRLAVGPPPPGIPPRGPPVVGIRGPPPGTVDPRGAPPARAEWPRPPEQYQQPPPAVAGFHLHRPPPAGVLLTQHPPPVVPGGPVTIPPPHLHAIPPHGGPPPAHPGAPVPHVNPAFFPSASSAPSIATGVQQLQQQQPALQTSHHTDAYGRPVVTYTPVDAFGQQHRAPASTERSSVQYSSSDNHGRRVSPERGPSSFSGDSFRDRHGPSPRSERHESSASQLNESEFDEILQRNKTVSSTAISRAVQDASAGEFASAIETLVTAISLIKQSKIAGDDRCKILISSLQDTLHGIESKSYGSKTMSRDRRSRSRDREREKQIRHRSRSREHEYRDRSREKERHYESERHREKPERSERERSERERSDRERDRERSDRERSDRERSDREREYRESRNSRH